jgi:pimeloyl-ACP methyl ester carboxylesterase
MVKESLRIRLGIAVSASIQYRLLAGILLLFAFAGCRCGGVNSFQLKGTPSDFSQFASPNLTTAQTCFQQAVHLEQLGDPACVDLYFRAATLAWTELGQQVDLSGAPTGPAANVYNSALSRLISSGQQFGRLDPRSGLQIRTGTDIIFVPTRSQGFLWQTHEIDGLLPVEDYSIGKLNNKYRYCGYGISTIAVHCNQSSQPFRKRKEMFSATALLRPVADTDQSTSGGYVLDLFDPLRVSVVTNRGTPIPLLRDLTAPIANRVNNQGRDYLKRFLQPGSTTGDEGLHMIEPYQPGKIPILFVHGLLSDPLVWANIANEIRGCPEFVQRYQLWAFEYATGEPFLKSASKLRRQLQEARAVLDPTCSDPALAQIMLVGHSMGGLVAQLQITRGGDQIWNAVSNRPLESIVTTPERRMKLAESFYFEPSPLISHVVFIGVPHLGSPWANRPVGKIGAKLVEEPSSLEAEHRELITNNPGVFSTEFIRRIPTSIDLLKPQSPLLRSVSQLPRDPRIQLHSIIGRGHWMIGAGDSDSVVPVSSAQTPGVVSETFIKAKHTELPNSLEGVTELFRILRSQLAEVDRLQSPAYVPQAAQN